MAELTNEQLADKNLVVDKLQQAITFKSSLSPLFYRQCHWDYEDYKRSSKEKAFYNYLSNIDSLNNYTKHCSNKDGVFTPETYFSWANEWERLSFISSFKQEHKDKVFYINNNSNNTNKKKDQRWQN